AMRERGSSWEASLTAVDLAVQPGLPGVVQLDDTSPPPLGLDAVRQQDERKDADDEQGCRNQEKRLAEQRASKHPTDKEEHGADADQMPRRRWLEKAERPPAGRVGHLLRLAPVTRARDAQIVRMRLLENLAQLLLEF